MKSQTTKQDAYERVTNQIIAAIEAGAGDFKMPWHHDGSAITLPVNVASKAAYRGVNTLALWAASHCAGYNSGIWGTYRQWAERGAQVRKGERGHCVVFWKMLDRNDDKVMPRTRDRRDRRTPAHVRAGLHGVQRRPGGRLHPTAHAAAP